MTLYHYTSLYHLRQILDTGYIKLTASNLLQPVAPRLVNGVFVDETDNYKPVVWLTDTLDFGTAKANGLVGGMFDKTEVAIVIENATLKDFKYWVRWAKDNRMDKAWFKALTSDTPNFRSWYITEKPIPVDKSVPIVYRPDVLERLNTK